MDNRSRSNLKNGKRGRPKQSAIDSLRTQAWVLAVMKASGKTATELDHHFHKKRNPPPGVARPCLWNKYERGFVVPRTAPGNSVIDEVEGEYPGTAWWFHHPLWDLLAGEVRDIFALRDWYLRFPERWRRMLIHPLHLKELERVKFTGDDIDLDFEPAWDDRLEVGYALRQDKRLARIIFGKLNVPWLGTIAPRYFWSTGVGAITRTRAVIDEQSLDGLALILAFMLQGILCQLPRYFHRVRQGFTLWLDQAKSDNSSTLYKILPLLKGASDEHLVQCKSGKSDIALAPATLLSELLVEQKT